MSCCSRRGMPPLCGDDCRSRETKSRRGSGSEAGRSLARAAPPPSRRKGYRTTLGVPCHPRARGLVGAPEFKRLRGRAGLVDSDGSRVRPAPVPRPMRSM